ncbi:MAG: hypothetical protein KAJ19_05155, partial [Gammaproteobacteria bacterium]|nr:hypothetical protein [Gammaproteobacteria bacterium]
HLLADKHHLAIYDSRVIEGLEPVDFEKEASQADFVLLCVPTFPHQQLLDRLALCMPSQCICLSIAKGLDEQGRSPAQIYEQTFKSQQPYGLLYGPMISEELRANRYGFAQLGCATNSIFEKVYDLYRGTKLFIQRSTDIAGISWSVILKNVYAIGFGMADQLQLGDNMRGYLAVAAMEELSAIMEEMGGNSSTPLHLAGLGDLITTATSDGSHHHELGMMLARGEIENIKGEGVHTLEMVEKFQIFDTSHYPLYSLIHSIVNKPTHVGKKFSDYIDKVHHKS